jgi:hypothetical protein
MPEERELYALKLIDPTDYLKAFLKLRNHLKMMIKKPEEWEKHAENLKKEYPKELNRKSK